MRTVKHYQFQSLFIFIFTFFVNRDKSHLIIRISTAARFGYFCFFQERSEYFKIIRCNTVLPNFKIRMFFKSSCFRVESFKYSYFITFFFHSVQKLFKRANILLVCPINSSSHNVLYIPLTLIFIHKRIERFYGVFAVVNFIITKSFIRKLFTCIFQTSMKIFCVINELIYTRNICLLNSLPDNACFTRKFSRKRNRICIERLQLWILNGFVLMLCLILPVNLKIRGNC